MKTDIQNANNYATYKQHKLQQPSKNNLRSFMQADAKGAKNKYQKQMEELLNTLNASNDNDEDMNVIKTTALLFQKYGNNAYTLLQEAVLRPNSCISLINDNSLKTQQDVVKYLCSANNNQQVIQNILKNHTR